MQLCQVLSLHGDPQGIWYGDLQWVGNYDSFDEAESAASDYVQRWTASEFAPAVNREVLE